MAQPLPNWLKPVTLRYQDTDQFTTGLVELPITYSGPSIPLKWPFTSVSNNPITAPSPAASALPSPQVVSFIDGSGPFTILGDVILTATTPTPPAPTASAAISTPPSAAPSNMPTIASSPTVVLVTTVYVAQSTPTSPRPPSSQGSDSPSYNPLALGFVFLLTIIIILILITTGILIKRHRRRKKFAGFVRDYDSPPHEVLYEFDPRLYPQYHRGSQAGRQNFLPTLREQQEAPVVTHQHEDLLDGNTKEKPDIQTEFLLTPQSRPVKNENRWAKFLPKLLLFGGNKKRNRPGDFVVRHHEPLPQTDPIYVNPYHDPSVNTNTGERVSKWRMQCGSFSSSALKRPSTISSYRNEPPPPDKDLFHQQNTPLKDGGLPDDPRSAFSAIQRGDAELVFSYNQSSTVSGPKGKSQTRAYQAIQETTPPTSPLKAKSMEAAVYALLDLTSPRRGVAHSPSPQPKKSIMPTKLFKIPSNPSRSFGSKTKSSRSTGKGSASKRYGDHEPPLLVEECNEEEEEGKEEEGSMSDGHGTDPGDSPLDFITIPLRSPPRCRRGTSSSVAGLTGVEDSMDSTGRSVRPSTTSPQAPLSSSAKRVRPKKTSSPALAGRPSIPSQLNTTTSGEEGHSIAPLQRVLGPANPPALLPTIARVPVPQYAAHDPTTSRCTPLFGRAPAHGSSPVPLSDRIPSSQDSPLSRPTPHDGTSRSRLDSSDLSSSAVSPEYPQDPSRAASNHDSSSLSPNPPPPLEPPQTSSPHHTTPRHSSAEDEDILFSGYFGSGSIGNFSGVSEMGILDT